MIKFLIYLFLFYLLFRFLFRLFMGNAYKAKVFHYETHHHYHTNNNQEPKVKVTPNTTTKQTRGNDKNLGEYVDFEEVK